MNNIPTQNNIAAIIDSVTSNMKFTESIIAATVGTITKIISKHSDLEKNISKMNSLEKFVSKYSSIITNIIKTLCKDLPGEGRTLSDLLGRIEKQNPESPNEKIVEWTVLEAAQQIPKILESTFKIFDTVKNFKFNFKTFFTLKKNIIILKRTLKNCILMFFDAFYSVGSDPKINDILNTFIKQPDIVESHIEYGYTENNVQFVKSKGDKSIQGKLGFLDIVDKALSIVNQINNLQFPSFIKFKITIKRFEKRLKRVIMSIISVFEKLNENDKISKEIPKISDIIIGGTIDNPNNPNNPKQYTGLYGVIQKLKFMFENIMEMEISRLSRWSNKIPKTFEHFGTILDTICTLVMSNSVEAMAEPSITKMISVSSSNIKSFISIINNIKAMVPACMAVRLFKKTIYVALNAVSQIIDIIAEMNKKEMPDNNSVVSDMETTLESLVSISKKAAILGFLSLPAIVGLLLTKFVIKALISFIKCVRRLSISFSDESAKRIKKCTNNIIITFNRIRNILIVIMMIGATIILTAAVIPYIIHNITYYIIPFIVMIAILMGLLWLSSKVLSSLSKQALKGMIKFGLAFIVIIGIIYISGLLILEVAKIANEFSNANGLINILKLLGNIILITAAVIVLGLIASALTAIMIPVLIGLGMILIVIGILTTMALMLQAIQELNLNPEKVKDSVKTVIDTSIMVIETIFNRDDEDTEGSKKSWIESVIEFVGGGLVTIIKAIMSIAFLAVMVVAILLVTILASQLKLIQQIDLDPGKVTSNVNLTINTAISVVDAITNRKDSDTEGSKKSWIRTLLEFVGADGLANIIDAIMAMAWLGFTIAIISLVKVLAEQLSAIGAIQLPTNINKKVDDIVSCANSVTTSIMNRKDPLDNPSDEKKTSFIKAIFPRLSAAAEMISRMRWISSIVSTVGIIKDLSTTLLELNNLPDTSNAKNNAIKLFDAIDEIIIEIQSRTVFDEDAIYNRITCIQKVINSINRIYDVKPKTIRNAKNILESNNEFIKQIDNINVTKLETATNMFKQMSTFSSSIKGDFDKLAEALSEKMLPVLEELKEVMGVIPEKLDIGFQNTSASISAANSPATSSSTAAQVRRENPNLSAEDVNRIVTQRMNEKAKADANGISAKLDDLMSLLRGFSGERVIVKTI